jgi:hypothetical protein
MTTRGKAPKCKCTWRRETQPSAIAKMQFEALTERNVYQFQTIKYSNIFRTYSL